MSEICQGKPELMRQANIFLKNDERILGDSDFVERALLGAQEYLQRKYALQAQGITLNRQSILFPEISYIILKFFFNFRIFFKIIQSFKGPPDTF